MSIRKPAVLIVDDQPEFVDLLAAVLRPEYEVLAATDAKRALDLAPSADLILLDIRMPEMDGLELCRLLRAEESTRRIPVIFVTGLAQIEQEKQGFDVGAVDYITKPIKPASVRARVRNHLELKAARDRLEFLATSDALTGIANRRRVFEELETTLARSSRSGEPFAVVIFDLDGFKRINDEQGHPAGDLLLKKTTSALQSVIRQGDVLGRYGGDEFLLVTHGPIGVEDALVERAEEAVRRETGLGLSAGIARYPEDGRSGSGLVATADTRLYEVKGTRRRPRKELV